MTAAAPRNSRPSYRRAAHRRPRRHAVGEMRGDWAGDFGQTQFLPSSYVKYAVDFDGKAARSGSQRAGCVGVDRQLSQRPRLAARPGLGSGQPNFEAIQAWNKAEVYAKTIALSPINSPAARDKTDKAPAQKKPAPRSADRHAFRYRANDSQVAGPTPAIFFWLRLAFAAQQPAMKSLPASRRARWRVRRLVGQAACAASDRSARAPAR